MTAADYQRIASKSSIEACIVAGKPNQNKEMDKSVVMGIGQRIRMARERAGLHQAEVARRLRLSRQSVQQWDNEQNAPKQSRLVELADVLQVDAQWLLTGESKDEWEDQELQRLLTLQERQLLGMFEGLDPARRVLLQELADTLNRNQEAEAREQRRVANGGIAHPGMAPPPRPRLVDKEPK